MCNLESEWLAHNQGKTLGWLAREKTQYNVHVLICVYVATQKIKREHKLSIHYTNLDMEMKTITKL